MKTVIEVEIKKLRVDQRYYRFDYIITIDGKEKECGHYNSDHCWQNDLKRFKRLLKNGEAVRLALEQLN